MSKYLEGLNDAQAKAVDHVGSPLLIVAGAGTGKTTVLTRRYARLLERGLTTEQIVALTFTEKAAGEMEDRVLQLVPNGTYDFWISTFHGFCQRILERYGLDIGIPNTFTLVTETDAWLLLKRRFKELPLEYYRPLGNPMKFLRALLSHISRAKDEGVTPDRYVEFAQSVVLDADLEPVGTSIASSEKSDARRPVAENDTRRPGATDRPNPGERARLQELAACYAKYQLILREEGFLDFGDLILETLRLLKERPRVLAELQAQFQEILVDEFQDTNWAQYELVKLLAGSMHQLTVVGDDDQAIYKFRGASLANILQFREDFPESATVLLTQNYRSHQEILDTAYQFIRKNDPYRLEVQLQDQGFSKQLTSAIGQGGKVQGFWYASFEHEVEQVVARIQLLKEQDPNLTWNDFAILSRSNEGAEPFVFALERAGIPCRFSASRGLYGTSVVVDLTAMFAIAAGEWDGPTVWRALNAPWYRIPLADIAILIQQSQQKAWGMWRALRNARNIPEISEESVREFEQITTQFDKLGITARRERPLKVLQAVLQETGALAEIMKCPESEKREAVSRLNAFAQRIKRYEQSTLAPTTKDFLEELRLEIESGEEGHVPDDPEDGPEAIKILTVHASKGLEFAHVFIVSLVDQRFPTRARGEAIPLPDGLVAERQNEGDAHLEEERRLFYVALTRAKKSVTITGAEDYGGTRKKKPSAFFEEAGIARVDQISGLELTMLEVASHARVAEERRIFPLKRRFSFTQLAAFEKCPLQYQFAHVYKLPVLGTFQKSFGQAIHQTLESILEAQIERTKAAQGSLFETTPSQANIELSSTGFCVSMEEAMAIYEEKWALNDDWYPDPGVYEDYRSRGREAVRGLVKQWMETPPDVAFLETPFEWRLAEDRSIKGSVDRMDRLPNGHYEIVDYKTGSSKTEESIDATAKQQLHIYQIAMEEKGLAIDELRYVYVLDGTSLQIPVLQGEEREKFREKLVGRMGEILVSQFPPNPSRFTCQYCDFKNICEFRKL